MSDNSNNSHTSARGKPGPLAPEQRAKKQAKFLAVYRECGNIKHSCKKAGINRTTYYEWRDTDEAFQAELEIAIPEAHDTLEFAAHERAVEGVLEPVVSNGQLVYEMIPVLDEFGEQKYKDGRPVYKRGKQVMKRVYSDSLLTTLLKANLPAKYRDKSSVEHTGKDGGPIALQRNPDLASFTNDEIDQMYDILSRANERREHGDSPL